MNEQQANQEHSAAYRDRILQKVKKLMTLALDGRGNETEAETALRQAQALMAKFNIDEAEVIREDLKSRRAEVIIERWKKAGMNTKPTGTKSKGLPTWAGLLGFGVGVFCDCRSVKKVVRENGNDYGECIVFAGYHSDVEVACWTFDYLLDCIRRRSRAFNDAVDKFGRDPTGDYLTEFGLEDYEGHQLVHISSKGRADTFRFHMAARLQTRLKELKAQWKAQEEAKPSGTSTGLVVLNDKMVALRELFGDFNRGQPAQHKVKGSGAAQAGYHEGNKTRLQPNPLGNSAAPAPITSRLRLN